MLHSPNSDIVVLFHASGFVKCMLLSCQMQASRVETVFWALSREKDGDVLHLEISSGITHHRNSTEGEPWVAHSELKLDFGCKMAPLFKNHILSEALRESQELLPFSS